MGVQTGIQSNDGAFSFDLPSGTNVGVYGVHVACTDGTWVDATRPLVKRCGKWLTLAFLSGNALCSASCVAPDGPAVSLPLAPAAGASFHGPSLDVILLLRLLSTASSCGGAVSGGRWADRH